MVTAGRGPALRRTPLSASWHLRSADQPHWAVMRARRVELGGRCGLRRWFGFMRHPQRAQLGVGCRNAVEANQVQPRSGHPRSQPLPELQRRHHEMRGAVAPRGLEPEHHLPGRVGLHALVGQGRARDGRRRHRARRHRRDRCLPPLPASAARLGFARCVPAAALPGGDSIGAYTRLDCAP